MDEVAIIEMFEFLHDVIVDINDESSEWCEEFTKEFDNIMKKIKEE